MSRGRRRSVGRALLGAALLPAAACELRLPIGRLPGDVGPDGSRSTCSTPLVADALALGERHVCVLRDGVVRCWGDGDAGQRGDDASGVVTTPVPVQSTATFDAVAAGGFATCARTTAGALLCFGDNFMGGLADGTSQNSATPVLTSVTPAGFALGVGTVCAFDGAGALTVWGDDGYGALGLGTTTFGAVRTETPAPGVVAAQLAPGSRHTCLLDTLGVARCAGDGVSGAIGQSATTRVVTFELVDTTTRYRAIDAGFERTCAIRMDGGLDCWGLNDPTFAVGAPLYVRAPLRLGTDADFERIAVGFGHLCALRDGGRLVCLGEGDAGQLGRPPGDSDVFVEVTPGVRYREVDAGRDVTCAIRSADDVVVCFGDNGTGQLGRTGPGTHVPTDVCLVP